MADWITTEKFEKTEYGQLNRQLNPAKYFGRLDRSRLPEGSTVVPDPKDGHFGIIKGRNGEPVGKVDRICLPPVCGSSNWGRSLRPGHGWRGLVPCSGMV